MQQKTQKQLIKMLDPQKTSKQQEIDLIKKVVEGDTEAIMIFNDLGLRHIVDVTQDKKPKNSTELLKILRRGLVGYYKALKLYLSQERYNEHKFTEYATYFIRKEVRGILS